MKLRVGLVGLGTAWQARHQPALRALGDRFEVKAVCEEVSLLAQQAARDFGAVSVDGFRAIAARQDVDAILMLSPQWYGSLPILAACDAGKAVYCAATFDLERDQARLVKKRVEQSGIAFMAEFARRHAPATLRLKELIATRLGRPHLVFCHQRLVVTPNNNATHRRWHTSPATRDLIELVDWCRYVVGDEPTSVIGLAHHQQGASSGDDYEMMSLDFSAAGKPGTGTVAQISCGHYIPDTWPEAISFRPPAALQVRCENGIAFVDLPSNLIWFDEAGRHQESLERERPVGEQLLLQFHRAVTSLVRRTRDLEDAYRAASIVWTARMSCRESRRIDLEF